MSGGIIPLHPVSRFTKHDTCSSIQVQRIHFCLTILVLGVMTPLPSGITIIFKDQDFEYILCITPSVMASLS